jgi:hypothetical protein
MNFFNFYDYNTKNDAIVRMRGSGSVVPKKATGKYIYAASQASAFNSRVVSQNVLLIHDYNSPNDALNLQKQLLQIQTDLTYIESLQYPQTLNMGLYDASNNPTGNLSLKAIKQKIDTLGLDLQYHTTYVPYTGADLLISNYGVVIICTKLLPFYDGLTEQTVDVSEYDPNFGYNLQNYINSGGNIIMANNVWQSTTIPNFLYANTPFYYTTSYTYGKADLTTVNFLNEHPILKRCKNSISFNPPIGQQSIITNLTPRPEATVVATTKKNIPFIATYNAQSGSKCVGINAYIFNVSSQGQNNVELAKIIYNSIYWCLKINT